MGPACFCAGSKTGFRDRNARRVHDKEHQTRGWPPRGGMCTFRAVDGNKSASLLSNFTNAVGHEGRVAALGPLWLPGVPGLLASRAHLVAVGVRRLFFELGLKTLQSCLGERPVFLAHRSSQGLALPLAHDPRT